MEELYDKMYDAYLKKVKCVEKDGTVHNAIEDLFSSRSDEADGIAGIGLSDGVFLKEHEIESIEIIDE